MILIIAQNTKQVYYASYPLCRNKVDWWIIIKSKDKGRIEIDNVLDVSYQNDVSIIQHEFYIEQEIIVQHPKHILQELSNDDILIIEEEMSENEVNE